LAYCGVKMLHISERESYTNSIAVPDGNGGDELQLVNLGKFESKGNFTFSQIAGHVSIHIISHGHGKFVTARGEYDGEPGDIFVFFAGEYYHYFDDPADPWRYVWIGLAGSKVNQLLAQSGFTAAAPRRHGGGNQLTLAAFERHFLHLTRGADKFAATAAAWELLGLLGPEVSAPEAVLADKIKLFIDQSVYSYPRLSDLAQAFQLSRSQIYRIFRQKYQISVEEYMLQSKLERGRRMLAETDWPLEKIAETLDFCDRRHFNKVFRRKCGVSPAEYRRAALRQNLV